MTLAAVWVGCNYQNENFKIGSQTKGRGTVIFLRVLSALIQATYYCVPHKHYHTSRLISAFLEYEQTKGAVKLHPAQKHR